MSPELDARLETEIDRLYQLPLDAFTEQRNVLAVRLRTEGRREDAKRVRSLAKPTASAWAVNELFWTARREFDDLIDASDRLRALQAGGATPNELRDAMRERRDALGAALRRAQAALSAQGHAKNAAASQRVATTLESLAAYGSARPPEIRPGRFTEDLRPPGFETLAGLAPPAASPPASARPAVSRKAEAQDDQARAERLRLEREVAAARRRADESRTTAEELARRAEGAQRELAEAERRLTKAKERAQEASAAAEKASDAARLAADELGAAERALHAAGAERGPAG